MMKSTKITIQTAERYEFVSITDEIGAAVRELGVEEGICVVSSSHTTAAVMINEDYDPDVGRDMTAASEALMNSLDVNFRHAEGNSDSHFLTGLFGHSRTLTVSGGRLTLGRWQGLFLCEFDGPRSRTVRVEVLEG